MFEKLMYVKTVIRAIAFMIKGESAKDAFAHSVECTRMEIDWVRCFEGKAK